MRTIVDLPKNQIEALGEICAQQKVSRAAAIRQAVAAYIQQVQRGKSEKAFGLWKSKKINSLEYQENLRAEWHK